MRRRHALIPLLAAAGGLAVTACGDPVSANRDFRALATTTITRVVDAAGLPHTHAVYAGPLVDNSGRAIRGTWFREVCDSVPDQPYACSVVMNAGRTVYAFAGRLNNVRDGVLTSAASRSPHATMTITLLKQYQQGPPVPPVLLQLSLRT